MFESVALVLHIINVPSCSNQVGDDILKAVIDLEGRNIPREFIELADMENVIKESAFNRDGMFFQ